MNNTSTQPRRAVIRVTGALVVAAGAALAVVRFFGEVPPGQDLEAAVGAIAFGAVIAAPGLLALLGDRGDRSALLLPAALLLIPLSFLSFALVTLPLLIPAIVLLRTWARTTSEEPAWRAVATTAAVLVLLVAALVALFAHQDPRDHRTESASYSSSDVVTFPEAALSLALTSLAVGAGWRLAPRDRFRATP